MSADHKPATAIAAGPKAPPARCEACRRELVAVCSGMPRPMPAQREQGRYLRDPAYWSWRHRPARPATGGMHALPAEDPLYADVEGAVEAGWLIPGVDFEPV